MRYHIVLVLSLASCLLSANDLFAQKGHSSAGLGNYRPSFTPSQPRAPSYPSMNLPRGGSNNFSAGGNQFYGQQQARQRGGEESAQHQQAFQRQQQEAQRQQAARERDRQQQELARQQAQKEDQRRQQEQQRTAQQRQDAERRARELAALRQATPAVNTGTAQTNPASVARERAKTAANASPGPRRPTPPDALNSVNAQTTAGPRSPAAQAAYQKALALRASQTGHEPSSTTKDNRVSAVDSGHSAAYTSALEHAKQIRARHTTTEVSMVNAQGNRANARLSQREQLALTNLSRQKLRVQSRSTFQSQQAARIGSLSPERQTAVKAKIMANRARAHGSLRPSAHPATKGKVPSGQLHRPKTANRSPKSGANGLALTGPVGTRRQTTAHTMATVGATNLVGHGSLNTTNNASLAQLLSTSGGFNNNPAALVGFILGSIGDAILLGPGLFSGGGASGGDAGGGGDSTGGDASGDDSGDDSGDSASAFDSGSVYMPDADSQTDPNASGSGVLLSVNSDSDGSDAASGADGSADASPDDNSNQQVGGGEVSPTAYDGSTTQIDAAPQVGRYLNVINLSGKTATIYVQYHAQDQNGNWNWFPADPNTSPDALSFDLNSGQAAQVWDGSWQVYADKARVWAASADGTQQWKRYKDTDLLLVSETDDQGQPCYYSAEIQTLSFGLK